MDGSVLYKLKNSSIVVSEDVRKKLLCENFADGTHIGIDLLNLILECDDVYEYTKSVFAGEVRIFLVSVESDNSICNGFTSTISKRNIYDAFVQAIRFGQIELTRETRKRFHQLKNMMYFDYYEEKNRDSILEIDIESEHYQIKCSDIFDFIRLEPSKCAKIIKNNDRLFGIKREYFLYAVSYYLKKNNLINKYEFSHYQETNVKAIINSTYVDIQAINRFLDTKDTIYKSVKIDQGLRDAVFKGMSDDFNLLEKVIYIYMKLCKILTYDQEFFASRQRGKALEKHKSVDHVQGITPDNNAVVCFEFNAIFTRFLHELGINFSSTYVNEAKEAYGSGHVNVEFRVDKFLILADAITSIFSGDLFGAKLNKKLIGFLCLNQNEDTIREFNASLEKVSKYIEEEEKKECEDNNLDELLREYESYTNSLKDLSLEEKIDVILEKISDTKKLKGMDMFSYIMMLGKVIFSSSEINNNVKFEIIKNNDTPEELDAMPLGVLTINTDGFSKDPCENDYYVYEPDGALERISIDDLAKKFDDCTYEHIDRGVNNIPGLALVRKGRDD